MSKYFFLCLVIIQINSKQILLERNNIRIINETISEPILYDLQFQEEKIVHQFTNYGEIISAKLQDTSQNLCTYNSAKIDFVNENEKKIIHNEQQSTIIEVNGFLELNEKEKLEQIVYNGKYLYILSNRQRLMTFSPTNLTDLQDEFLYDNFATEIIGKKFLLHDIKNKQVIVANQYMIYFINDNTEEIKKLNITHVGMSSLNSVKLYEDQIYFVTDSEIVIFDMENSTVKSILDGKFLFKDTEIQSSIFYDIEPIMLENQFTLFIADYLNGIIALHLNTKNEFVLYPEYNIQIKANQIYSNKQKLFVVSIQKSSSIVSEIDFMDYETYMISNSHFFQSVVTDIFVFDQYLFIHFNKLTVVIQHSTLFLYPIEKDIVFPFFSSDLIVSDGFAYAINGDSLSKLSQIMTPANLQCFTDREEDANKEFVISLTMLTEYCDSKKKLDIDDFLLICQVTDTFHIKLDSFVLDGKQLFKMSIAGFIICGLFLSLGIYTIISYMKYRKNHIIFMKEISELESKGYSINIQENRDKKNVDIASPIEGGKGIAVEE